MVYDAILAGGQTRLKLQWMYGILAHLQGHPTGNFEKKT